MQSDLMNGMLNITLACQLPRRPPTCNPAPTPTASGRVACLNQLVWLSPINLYLNKNDLT